MKVFRNMKVFHLTWASISTGTALTTPKKSKIQFRRSARWVEFLKFAEYTDNLIIWVILIEFQESKARYLKNWQWKKLHCTKGWGEKKKEFVANYSILDQVTLLFVCSLVLVEITSHRKIPFYKTWFSIICRQYELLGQGNHS